MGDASGRRESSRADTERAIREAHEARDFARAATIAIEGYGRELSSFVAARLGVSGAAGDVFGMLCEDIWNGLPGFRFSSSFRTWAYTLARHAIARHRASPHERRKVDVSTLSPLADALVHEARAATATWKQTAARDKVRAIRERLSDDDRELLVLRVDRGLSFDDIATIVAPDDGPDARKRRAAAIRKRFERAKERLRVLAVAEGLLPERA